MSTQHQSLIKTPKQLVTVVVLAFIVPIAIVVLLSQLFTGGEKGMKESESAVLARIRPVGDVKIADAAAPKGQATGEQAFNQVCKTCHETGIAGAHKVGDKAAWAKVIAQGPALTFQHAIAGIRAMPPRGGNPDLADIEVQRAAVFMINKAGANWKEPAALADMSVATPPGAAATTAAAPAAAAITAAAPAAAAKPAAAPVVASATPAPASPAPAAAAPAAVPQAATAKPDGKKVYDSVCMVCHGAGIAGAPKFGDKPAWAPRLKTGIDLLYASAIKGKGAMPPKGGNDALSDIEVKAAVDYMAAAAR